MAETPPALSIVGSETSSPRLFVDPSFTTVSLGKASLTVKPLIHDGKSYLGDYGLKVTPYFFKSERGKLELEASEATLRSILEGAETDFKGKATNAKNGKSKVVTGTITPIKNNGGTVTFSVETENGPMVFESSFRFGK